MSRTTRKLLARSWIASKQHYINCEAAQYKVYVLAREGGAGRWACRRWKGENYDPVIHAKDQLNRWTRDGRDGLTCSRSNTGYKTDSKKKIRRLNKEFCRREVAGQDTDDTPHAIRKDGKTYKWDWW